MQRNSYQLKSLFYKNVQLQTREISTNVCQIVTPLICLGFVYLIKELAFDKFNGSTFKLDFPYLFNVPSLYNSYPSLLELNCLQWYFYDFDKDIPEDDRHFIGWNNGIAGANM